MLQITTPQPLLIWSDATADTGIGTAAEALALVAEGIVPADGLKFRADGTDRTGRIVYHYDHRRTGLDWRLAITGNGHWCEGSDGRGNALHAGSFRTAAEAVAAAVEWVETGRDASERRAAA